MKQYKNEYRAQICAELGKIRTAADLQLLQQVTELLTRVNAVHCESDDVERWLFLRYMCGETLRGEDLKLIRVFSQSYINALKELAHCKDKGAAS